MLWSRLQFNNTYNFSMNLLRHLNEARRNDKVVLVANAHQFLSRNSFDKTKGTHVFCSHTLFVDGHVLTTKVTFATSLCTFTTRKGYKTWRDDIFVLAVNFSNIFSNTTTLDWELQSIFYYRSRNGILTVRGSVDGRMFGVNVVQPRYIKDDRNTRKVIVMRKIEGGNRCL